MQDSLGDPVTTDSGEALRLLDAAIDMHARAWPGALQTAEAATREDPDLAIGHALQGLIHGIWGRREAANAAMARALALAGRMSAREASLLELVDHIVRGRGHAALAWMLLHLRQFPSDLLALTPAVGAYGLFAFSGRADHNEQRLSLLDELERHYPPDFPWLLANRGWTRIELGAAQEGLEMALRAIELRPENAHNAHIVAHGFHEAGRFADYLAFVAAWLPGYSEDGLMWGHLQWHAALAELGLGDEQAAMRRCLGPVLSYLPRGAPFMALHRWRGCRSGSRGWPAPHGRRCVNTHPFTSPKAPTRSARSISPWSLPRRATDRRSTGQHSGWRSLRPGGSHGARAAQAWVAALQATIEGKAEDADRFFERCEQQAVRLGGSNAQRSIIAETRAARQIPPAIRPLTNEGHRLWVTPTAVPCNRACDGRLSGVKS